VHDAADAQSKLEQLYNDKAHLLEMLSHLDAEKSALSRRPARGMQQQLLQQQAAPGTPTSAAAGSQISGSGSSMPGGGMAATTGSVDSLEKLQSRLQVGGVPPPHLHMQLCKAQARRWFGCCPVGRVAPCH
jgi:hypothetical protein